MRVSKVMYTVRDIKTDVEFADDVDMDITAIPELAEVTFEDGAFVKMTCWGSDRRDVYGPATITDWEGLDEPWRSVAKSIIDACQI